jgi:hypothetical protein
MSDICDYQQLPTYRLPVSDQPGRVILSALHKFHESQVYFVRPMAFRPCL